MGTLSIVQNRAENLVKGPVGVVESGASIVEAGYQTVVNNEDFLTHENKIHLTRLCQMGIYSVTAGAIMGDTVPDGDNCQLQGDACYLPRVENGVFNGDAQDLQLLAEQGQIPGTTHMEEGEYQRTDSARNDFLEAHSISDTKGWQVHHIQPLCEGGADDPSNMVLIDPDNHAKITSAHQEYYGWKK